MRTITPFANASESLSIGELTVENRTDRVALYGSLDLTCDRKGLTHARQLKALLDAVVQALEGAEGLPERVAAPAAGEEVANPFR